MPATRRRFHKCGHLGRGAHCHRCAHAELLEGLEKKAPGKWPAEYKEWSLEQVKAEAARLRAPAAPKRGRMRGATVAASSDAIATLAGG